MCGIVGIVHFDRSRVVARQIVEAMTDKISHRGPNGQGVFLDRNVGLGHRRLSVIDLAGGTQPMTDPSSKRTIVYNGEFYNFREVREQCLCVGHSFLTKSDTEVLVKIAEGDPRNWIHRVNGMFAFAVWEPRDRRLTLVRDRFGVKPLYFTTDGRSLAFASEIKSLLGLGEMPAPALDPEALPEYLAFRSVLEPRTLFKNIRQLPAGHFLHMYDDGSGLQVLPYWDENRELAGDVVRGERQEFQSFLEAAVRRRLVSDVPIGTFNSGGVDSSLVSREVRRQVPGDLHTFSVGFEDPKYDESKYAQDVSRTLGTIHHAERLPPQRYAELLPRAIWHHDEPLCHPHSVQLMHLSSVARQFVTVVLTGEGADEAFFGYPRLHVARIAELLGRLRGSIGQVLAHTVSHFGDRRIHKLVETLSSPTSPCIDAHRFVPLRDLRELLQNRDYCGERTGKQASVCKRQSRLEQLLEYERQTYLKSLLLRLDKMTMAHGLEARTPFLDFELVLWSKRLRSREKVGFGWSTKELLKREAARHFSRQLARRRKVGFGVPLKSWFRSHPAFRDMLNEMSSSASLVTSIVPASTVRRYVMEHVSGDYDHSETLWTLLNLHVWNAALLRDSAAAEAEA